MQVAFADPCRDVDALAVAVDEDATPFDVEQFLDALDALVERRLRRRHDSGSPALSIADGIADSAEPFYAATEGAAT
jgi:hypothetical protein